MHVEKRNAYKIRPRKWKKEYFFRNGVAWEKYILKGTWRYVQVCVVIWRYVKVLKYMCGYVELCAGIWRYVNYVQVCAGAPVSKDIQGTEER